MRAEGRRDVTVLTVRNLDDETRAGLKQLGIEHGRSMEGEARVILAEAVRARRASTTSNGLGSRIKELFADLDWQGVERQQDPARAASFEQS
jgi:plasmid stability protein